MKVPGNGDGARGGDPSAEPNRNANLNFNFSAAKTDDVAHRNGNLHLPSIDALAAAVGVAA